VMRAAGDSAPGLRLRALIVVLWRAGLRIHEALAPSEGELDHRRGSLVVRRGKGGRRREVGMDEWAREQLQARTALRLALPVGPLLCVITGPTRGRPWSNAAARSELRRTAAAAGVRRRLAPHQLRHVHAVERPTKVSRWSSSSANSAAANLGITSKPPRHRQCRNHRRRPRPGSSDGPGQRLARL
jgi:site-specific recombinase XerD